MSEFIPKGICAKKITFTIQNDCLSEVDFQGGCNGNLKGICNLVQGMPVQEVIKKLRGIECGGKPTSCPDQLAQALEETLNSH